MKKSVILFIWLVIFYCWFCRPPAYADWINLSGAENAPNIAEIYINDDHVKVQLEIFVNDIMVFDRLIPDEFFKDSGIQRPSAEDRIRLFAKEDLQIIADGKKHLMARLEVVDTRMRKERYSPMAGKINPYTRQLIPGPPADKRVLYAEIIYPFTGKPESLTFIPPMDEKGFSKAAIGFTAYHKQVPVVDFKQLSGQSTVKLDWSDPWYSQFEGKPLKRWQQSGLMTYLYVEPYEIRHETLVRVRDLEAWMDLNLRGNDYIEADEANPLKQRVGDFLLNHSNVLIDGKQVRPILDRTSFVKYTKTRTYFIDQPERMHLDTAMLGVIITYLTKGMPKEVTVDWDLFSDRIQKVPATATDPAGPFPSYVMPDDPVLTWTNYLKKYRIPTVTEITVDESLTTLKIPLASILCLLCLLPVGLQIRKRRKIGINAGLTVLLIGGSVLLYPYLNVAVAKPAMVAPEITEKEAVAILDNLLKNIYRSFDFREEEDVYDRLATSVSGDLLSEIYLQNRKSLVVTEAGGARARVKEVEILDVDVASVDDHPLGLLFHARWTAMGTVGHWGHIHMRKNQYDANITAEPVEGAWKMTGLELLEEKRIDPYANPAKGIN